MYAWTAAAALSLLIWIYLFRWHGGFWRIERTPLLDASANRTVVAVVPARNEADVIGPAITSLLSQEGISRLHVVLVDDGSTDGTAATARQTGNESALTILTGAPLPEGWTGKLWAVSQGVSEALNREPDYLLFTDADICHDSHHVADLVAKAEAEQLDLASHMVLLSTSNFAERALIPAFVYFFLQLYPPRWIASSEHKTAGAAGGCILLRPAALARIGGHASIRGQIIDDCALARAIKNSGGKLWMGLTNTTRSIRPYGGFAEIGRMISRSAFNQLQHSILLLIGTLLGLVLTYVIPIAAISSGHWMAAACGGAAGLLMIVTYLPMIRFFNLPGRWAAVLPFVALFYAGATLHSAIQYWRGQGGVWKGRIQDR